MSHMEKHEEMLISWNGPNILADSKGTKYYVNVVSSYESKEDFLKEAIKSNYVPSTALLSEVKIGGISTCASINGHNYALCKKHGKIDREAYYIKTN